MALWNALTPDLLAQLQAMQSDPRFDQSALMRQLGTTPKELNDTVALPRAFPKPFKVVEVEVPEHEKHPLFGRF